MTGSADVGRGSSLISTERTIGPARVIMAAALVLSGLIDPRPRPGLVSQIEVGYLAYALVLMAVSWRGWGGGRRLDFIKHALDITVFSVSVRAWGAGPNQLFVFLSFILFSGTLRWGWRGTVSTGGLVIAIGLPESLLLSGSGADPMLAFRARMRVVHVLVISGLLIYFERYEAAVREGLRRLASWPRGVTGNLHSGVQEALEQAAAMVRARQAVAVWTGRSDPWLHVARWDGTQLTMSEYPASECGSGVAAQLAGSAFLCSESVESGVVLVKAGQRFSTWQGVPVHSYLVPHLQGGALVCAPFSDSDRIAGRLFLVGLIPNRDEVVALAEVVAGEVGARIDELYLSEKTRQVSVMSERLRVARDLHDGVLQSLTGVRLQLQNLADDLAQTRKETVRRCLLSLEEALAIEQRELRGFIEGLKISSRPREGLGLADSLASVRERIGLKWKVPISIAVEEPGSALPAPASQVVPLMVHEAVVNALRHARPSWVAVDVRSQNGHLRLLVSNDGQGFPFRGRYDHVALERAHIGPVSLRERVTSLGGTLTIESTDAGSTVEITLPIANREDADANPPGARRRPSNRAGGARASV
jgi:signal transduction histidine kinase